MKSNQVPADEKIGQPEIGLVNPALIQSVKDAIIIPVLAKDEFWKIEAIGQNSKQKKTFFSSLRKKNLNKDEVKDLKKAIEQSPGNTKIKIKKLRKKFPEDSTLLMISAICSFGMLLNSNDKSEVRNGLRIATREAATALLSDQISVTNINQFFQIYFTYLDRFKLFQIRIYEEMLQDPRMESRKRDFLNALQIVEQLFSEKEGIQEIINRLKKRIKPAMHDARFKFTMIAEAAHHVVNENSNEKCRMGTASETIAYTHAIAAAFSRIPILSPVVDSILTQLPDEPDSFLLRKVSINTKRNFIKFRMAAAEGDKEQMSKIGMTILKENTIGILKLEGRSLHQPYETDPFFNLAYLAELTLGLYEDQKYQETLDAAMKAMESVIKRDMSKNHVFTETATAMSQKLSFLKASCSHDNAS